MKVFYYITAHKNPRQLSALVNALRDDRSIICIHIDARSDLKDFMNSASETKTVYFVRNRVRVFWGGFSQVEATLTGMREFAGSEACYFVSLSGQDFPIKPTSEFHDLLKNKPDNNFIVSGRTESTWKDAVERIRSVRYIDFFADLRYRFKVFSPFINKVEGLVNKTVALRSERKLPYGYALYGGSSWFVLNKSAISYILQTISQKPLLTRFFKKTVCADEHFFHTILCNSELVSTVIQDNLRYVRFQEGQSNPEILTMKDYETLISASAFFARKFDLETDPGIIDKLHNFIHK